MRIFLKVISILFIITLTYKRTCGQSHDLILGTFTPGITEPIFTQTIHKENGGWFSSWSKKEKTIKFPTVNKNANTIFHSSNFFLFFLQGYPNERKITFIAIKDNFKNGKGGYAKIVRGGLNQTFVEILLRSRSGNAMHFNVTLYADRNASQFMPVYPRPQPPPPPPPGWYFRP